MDTKGALEECNNTLLRNPDTLHDWLSIADKYMQSYAESPKTFLLPRAHEFLKPIIETYALDLEGFTYYLVGLRDKFDRHSTAYKSIQTIYRRVNGRLIQQQRRERVNRAVEKAEKLYGEIPFTQRMQWMAELEHQWAKRRLEFLEANRRRYKNDRLPTEDRAELLATFWKGIDQEISEGKLPKWNSPNREATQP